MNDPILKHRLQLLEDNLRTALETTKSFQEDLAELGMTFQRRGELSDAFTNVAQGQLRTLQRFLAKLEQMDTRSAWKEYGSLCEQSSQIYREVLEAMLGLAIRRKRMDNAICTVADELIRGIGRNPIRADTFTIPASQEAYARTVARLVRMRFPEWTIWSLPFTAHEFGHVAIEEDNNLAAFGDTEAHAEVESDPQYREIKRKMEEGKKKLETLRAPQGAEAKADLGSDPQCDEIERETEQQKKMSEAAFSRAQDRIHEFLADAFAVYTIGPCYAASLIVLRLYPLSADSDARRASDQERAALVLEILNKMNRMAPKPYPYTEFITKLSDAWSTIMAKSGAPPLVELRRGDLAKLADRVWDQLEERLFMLQYPTSSEVGGGWNVARGWYENWTRAADPNKLPVPENLSAFSRLRDALNAAWQYRLFSEPAELEPAAAATRALCDKIIRHRRDQEAKEQRIGGVVEVGGSK